MKNFTKTKKINSFILIFLIISLFTYPYTSLFITKKAEAEENNEENCTSWELRWENDNSKVNFNNINDFPQGPPPIDTIYNGPKKTLPSINQNLIRENMSASSTHYKDEGNLVKWVCVQMEAIGGLYDEMDLEKKQGFEECEAAIRIAQQYGAYVSLSETLGDKISNIKKRVINDFVNNILKGLQNEATKIVKNISLSDKFDSIIASTTQAAQNPEQILSWATDALGVSNYLKSERDKFVGQVKNQTDRIIKDMGIKYGSDLVKQAQNIINIGGGLPGIEAVPVNDSQTQLELKKVQTKLDASLAEQKKQKAIEAIRKECNLLLRQTVQSIKSALLYQWTTEVVSWIENGGIEIVNGEIKINPPQFVKRPDDFIKKVGIDAINRFISHNLPQLCEPFRLRVSLEIPSVSKYTNPYYDPNLRCTLNETVDNIQDFYNDFRSGGWVGFREIIMPQNNYYGASMLFQEKIEKTRIEAENKAANELAQNKGFRNDYICISWSKYEVSEDINDISSCGIEGLKENISIRWENEKCFVYKETVPSSKEASSSSQGIAVPTGIPNDLTSVPDPDPQKFLDDFIVTSSDGKIVLYSCNKKEISKSGFYSEALAKQAIEADINQIINSQDLMNIEQIIQNAIINKITKVGVRGIQKLLNQLPALTGEFRIEKIFNLPQSR